ncbi:MAG: NAD(P)-dependent oxidoreductase [Rhodospirillales bacterium]|nr:NAD(P)-dependent oxidoreductase [Rhodospirillales bacterium]
MAHIVIGASGFTGRHLLKSLVLDKEDVIAVDIKPLADDLSQKIRYIQADIREPEQLAKIPLSPNDTIIHLAARQYHLAVPHRGRAQFFEDVNVRGTANVLDLMDQRNCKNLIYFSTDMVYGLPQKIPLTTDHPLVPFGPYGASKMKSERLCAKFRERGFNITIFRPRLISGPERLGILEKLFTLIEKGFPVPMIGNGSNHYQMVSVFDCVDAIRMAIAKDFPSNTYNLGSANPPTVKELLSRLIRHAGSRSILLPTPAGLVKGVLSVMDGVGMTLMYPEQFLIADQNCIVDIKANETELGWIPRHDDQEMIFQAFDEFRNVRSQSPTIDR